ncbi:N-acetyltransferase [Calidifontibacillus erzurumensis]|uniref:N-acetyltransferase n=1 Tax=Calidifontibacillus erzurumensis TaxID=2741433 RepID=A0A8J8KAM7_9BACI|nr:N-acetyltransferase [Calidifontibacillus erzurumensis]NSL50767.1 N-acetyltransferase [Calidifontibacillus erzurumensis]
MEFVPIERLSINFKTLEDFKSFKEFGDQELQMIDDLQGSIIENDCNSPFYGIYYGDKLVARMSLYHTDKKFDYLFEPKREHLYLSKLEVLPQYRNRGFGKQLIDFAKSFNLPIVTKPRVNSEGFWVKMGFMPFKPVKDVGEKLLVWYPEHLSDSKIN